MSFARFTAAGEGALSVLSMRLAMPIRGAWYAEIELDATTDEAPAEGARAELSFAGRIFSGYVLRSREWQGRTRVMLEAGAAGMRPTLAPLQLESALVRTVAEQIIGLAGEVVSSDAASPTDVLTYYNRTAQAAGVALSAALSTVGLSWRFNDAGEVWYGAETWTEVTDPDALELEPFGESATTHVSCPTTAPFSPGLSYGGRRIERVVYTLSEGDSLSAVLTFARDGGGDLRGAFGRAVRAAVPELPHVKRWPSRVVRQGADRRLELVPDDASSMAGSPPVPPLYGLPGARCEVPEGARVGLVHEAGDARRPRAEGWEEDTPATSIRLRASSSITLGSAACEVGGGGSNVTLSGGGAAVARVGDIASYLVWDSGTMTMYVASSLTAPYVPVAANPNTPNPPPTGTPGTPVTIGAGSQRVSAG